MSEMLKMMVNFFSDYFRYRDELKKQDRWIKKFAAKKDYSVNPHWMFYTNLRIWLIESEKLFGKRYCPCFEPSGDPEFDRKLICPCAFIDQEIAERGTCHCTLFGRKDLTSKDYKEAEAHLLEEYQGPLNLNGNTLDTRTAPLDPLRGLPVPDPLHQTKRAIRTIGVMPLKVIVDREEFARHLEMFASRNGLKATTTSLEDGAFEVFIDRA